MGWGIRFSDLAKQRTLIVSDAEMNYIIKIIKCLEESDLLVEGISKRIKIEAKEKKFLSMLLGLLGASLLGNLLASKVLKAKISGQ